MRTYYAQGLLALKHFNTCREKKKARLVALGHRDKLKDYILSGSPTLMRYSMRILLCLASCYDLIVYSRDVKQAYLQSDTPFQRDVFIRIPEGYEETEKDFVLKVQKPLYGLKESGSYWFDTYSNFFENSMRMTPLLLDPCMMYKKLKGMLVGIVGIIVDDTLEAGTSEFIKMEDRACQKFLMNPRQVSKFEFSGMSIEQRGSLITLSQHT